MIKAKGKETWIQAAHPVEVTTELAVLVYNLKKYLMEDAHIPEDTAAALIGGAVKTGLTVDDRLEERRRSGQGWKGK